MLAGSGIVGMFLDLTTAFVWEILPKEGTKRRTKNSTYKRLGNKNVSNS